MALHSVVYTCRRCGGQKVYKYTSKMPTVKTCPYCGRPSEFSKKPEDNTRGK